MNWVGRGEADGLKGEFHQKTMSDRDVVQCRPVF